MNVKQKLVAIIEPDKLLARQYAAAFASRGVPAVVYQNAETAIAEIDKQIPALIILELQLPNHSGVEFLHELRSYKDLAMIPVILQSFVPHHELGMSDKMQRLLKINEYLYKPQTSLSKLLKVSQDAMGLPL